MRSASDPLPVSTSLKVSARMSLQPQRSGRAPPAELRGPAPISDLPSLAVDTRVQANGGFHGAVTGQATSDAWPAKTARWLVGPKCQKSRRAVKSQVLNGTPLAGRVIGPPE